MRRRYVIHKGISKKIIAISRFFEVGDIYTAAIYNPKDLSVKITANAYCVEDNDLHQIVFDFPAEETDKLKIGYATIEIYDPDKNMMVYRDNFAVIRKNSLPITHWTYLMNADIEHSSTSEPNTATRYDNYGLIGLGDSYDIMYVGMRIRLVPIGGDIATPWEGTVKYKSTGPYYVVLADTNGNDADFETMRSEYNTYMFKLEYVN